MLNRRIEVNEDVIILIIHSYEQYGIPYCPCRVEKNEKTICPCFYHIDEIRKNGRCRCGLFRAVS
ncbi:ferredoxin-thioredoxin reductase catalytic domain-containing protein [Thermogladius sp. 4427co]|uniref:ferredoxin-thioredoxin reductase catalytic domain-containing protein n=1 Tax=Thermogladius sp. 4427co TaxID=3450718 RepID=UPI003F7A8766